MFERGLSAAESKITSRINTKKGIATIFSLTASFSLEGMSIIEEEGHVHVRMLKENFSSKEH